MVFAAGCNAESLAAITSMISAVAGCQFVRVELAHPLFLLAGLHRAAEMTSDRKVTPWTKDEGPQTSTELKTREAGCK